MSTTDHTMGDHERLVAALVAHSPEHGRMLATSPTFHQSIEELARMLPAMVAGLAMQCRGTDRMLAARVRVARQMPPPTLLVTEGADYLAIKMGSTIAERAAADVCAGSYQPGRWGIDEGSVVCAECGATLFPDEGDDDGPTIPAHPRVPS